MTQAAETHMVVSKVRRDPRSNSEFVTAKFPATGWGDCKKVTFQFPQGTCRVGQRLTVKTPTIQRSNP